MSEASQCANCARAIDIVGQKFCPACGQPAPAHRIDWHFLGHELEHSVLHMDRGILYTLKNLMLRPGHFIRDYIEGRRASHIKPLMLIMIMAAVVVFLAKYFLEGGTISSSLAASDTVSARAQMQGQLGLAWIGEASRVAQDWIDRNYAASTLMLLPFEAAAFKLAFRRVGKLNYPEWLVITTFLTAQTFFIVALSIPLEHWYPQTRAWALLLAIVYSVFSLVQFFRPYPRWKTLVRSLFGFAIFMLANLALSFALGTVLLALSARH